MGTFDDMWAGLKAGVQTGLDQVQNVGVPIVKASIEAELMKTLQKQQDATQSQVNAAVKTLAESPSSPLGEAVKTTIQKSVLSLYAPQIAIGAVVLLGLAYVFMKKKG